MYTYYQNTHTIVRTPTHAHIHTLPNPYIHTLTYYKTSLKKYSKLKQPQ